MPVDGHRLVPHPEAFGAGIDGRTNSKPLSLPILVQQNAIQKERFASSVLASHCNDSQVLIQQLLALQEFSSFVMELKAYTKFKLVSAYSKLLVGHV